MLTSLKLARQNSMDPLRILMFYMFLNIHVPFLAIVPGYGTFRC
jgi:hypothetical protein